MAALGPEQYPILQDLRLCALRTDPGAFVEPLAVAEERRAEGWRRLLDECARPGFGTVLAAWIGPESVGMAGLRRHGPLPQTEGEVWGVFVRSPWRGRGVGAALMRAVEADARRLGLHRLVIEIARTNEAAARLAMASGFRGTGQRAHRPMGDGQTRELVQWAKEV